MLRLMAIDAWLFNFINKKCHRSWLDAAMALITNLGGATCTAIICITLLFINRVPNKNLLFAMGLCLLLTFTIKNLSGRLRPYLKLPDSLHWPKLALYDYSFPSGHTASITAWCTVVVCFMPAFWLFAVLAVFLVGFSRIYLGLHYPTDVVMGMIIGFLMGLLACTL